MSKASEDVRTLIGESIHRWFNEVDEDPTMFVANLNRVSAFTFERNGERFIVQIHEAPDLSGISGPHAQ